MADKGDQNGCEHEQQDVSADHFQHFIHDAVENTGIVHHAKEQDCKDEQDRRGRNARHTGFDILAHIRRAETDGKADQDRQQDKHDRRRAFAPEQKGNDQDHQGKACDT